MSFTLGLANLLALRAKFDIAQLPPKLRQSRPSLLCRVRPVVRLTHMSKRRARSYTLPIIIGIGFLLVAGLAAWRRADLIATLSDQTAHGENTQAACRGAPTGIDSRIHPVAFSSNQPLVTTHVTAEAAQIAINQLLDEWQRAGRQPRASVATSPTRSSKLSGAIAEQRRTFPIPQVIRGLRASTREMVRVAEKCPPRRTRSLAMHCDEIMTLIGNASFTTAVQTKPPRSLATPNRSGAGFRGTTSSQIADRSQLEQAFRDFSAPIEFRRTTVSAAAIAPRRRKRSRKSARATRCAARTPVMETRSA